MKKTYFNFGATVIVLTLNWSIAFSQDLSYLLSVETNCFVDATYNRNGSIISTLNDPVRLKLNLNSGPMDFDERQPSILPESSDQEFNQYISISKINNWKKFECQHIADGCYEYEPERIFTLKAKELSFENGLKLINNIFNFKEGEKLKIINPKDRELKFRFYDGSSGNSLFTDATVISHDGTPTSYSLNVQCFTRRSNKQI